MLFRPAISCLLRLFPLILAFAAPHCEADTLGQLSQDFWVWRAQEQPVTSDDIPRLDRPAEWTPRWSAQSLSEYRARQKTFEQRLTVLKSESAAVAEQVDWYLMRSAIARVRWELDIVKAPQRNPAFYVDQTLGAYLSLVLPPPPFTPERSASILRVLKSVPQTLQDARQNLTDARGPFTDLALAELQNAASRLSDSVAALHPLLSSGTQEQFSAGASEAGAALAQYATWLRAQRSHMSEKTAIGRQAYRFFLDQVGMLPYTPEALIAFGHRDWASDVTNQLLEERRSGDAPPLKLFATQQQQIQRESADERSIRSFLQEKKLLTVPSWLPHWTFAAMPAYVEPLSDLGEADDFASLAHLDRTGIRYIDPPSPQLGYFAKAMATDPRTLIVHEGVPGHYSQLMLSWHNPDPIRRHYYDSGVNEGIGFYAEGMLLAAGLFDDSPRSRELLWNFARLRALRVEADVNLALGTFTLQQAAHYLAASVPMDEKTALGEASFFAATPGQAISYLIGKVEIEDMLAEAKKAQGDSFDLRSFHDYLWSNGNVPIVLQMWELLGDKQGIDPFRPIRN